MGIDGRSTLVPLSKLSGRDVTPARAAGVR